jgi:hypothetical protein
VGEAVGEGVAPEGEGEGICHTPFKSVGHLMPGVEPPAAHGGSDTPWNMVPEGAVAIVFSEDSSGTMRRKVGVHDDRGTPRQVVA